MPRTSQIFALLLTGVLRHLKLILDFPFLLIQRSHLRYEPLETELADWVELPGPQPRYLDEFSLLFVILAKDLELLFKLFHDELDVKSIQLKKKTPEGC